MLIDHTLSNNSIGMGNLNILALLNAANPNAHLVYNDIAWFNGSRVRTRVPTVDIPYNSEYDFFKPGYRGTVTIYYNRVDPLSQAENAPTTFNVTAATTSVQLINMLNTAWGMNGEVGLTGGIFSYIGGVEKIILPTTGNTKTATITLDRRLYFKDQDITLNFVLNDLDTVITNKNLNGFPDIVPNLSTLVPNTDLDGFPLIPPFYLLDTFTGSGDLSTHVGENGANWTAVYPPATDLTLFTLTGNGEVFPNVVSASNYFASTYVPDRDDFVLESKVRFLVPVPTAGTYTSIFALDDGDSYLGGEAQVQVQSFNGGASWRIYAGLYTANASEVTNPTQIVVDAAYDTPIVMRLEVSNGRKTYKMFINDVLLDTHTHAVAPPFPKITGFSMGSNVTAPSVYVDYVRGWTLPNLPPAVQVTPAVDFVLDTFTGTGNLSTHVGETGAAWTTAVTPGWGTDPSHFVLNGTGGVTSQYHGAVSPSGVVTTDEFFVEIDVNVVDDIPLQFMLFFRSAAANIYTYYQLNVIVKLGVPIGPDPSYISMLYVNKNGAGTASAVPAVWSPVVYSPPVVTAGLHTIRMEVHNALKELYFDGVPIEAWTDNTVTGPNGLSLLFNYPDAIGLNSISRFRVAPF